VQSAGIKNVCIFILFHTWRLQMEGKSQQCHYSSANTSLQLKSQFAKAPGPGSCRAQPAVVAASGSLELLHHLPRRAPSEGLETFCKSNMY